MASRAAQSKSDEPKSEIELDQIISNWIELEQSDTDSLQALVPEIKKIIDSLRDALILSYDQFVSEKISAPVPETNHCVEYAEQLDMLNKA